MPVVHKGNNLMSLGHQGTLVGGNNSADPDTDPQQRIVRKPSRMSSGPTVPDADSGQIARRGAGLTVRSEVEAGQQRTGSDDTSSTSLRPSLPSQPLVESKSPGMVNLGVAIMIVGSILLFSAFGFAALSLLAALGSVQFVSNVVFARLVLQVW
jgi:hypothetical protein